MSDSKRIIKNSIFLYARKLISIVTAIYSIRFVLQNLGIEDYGIYSLLGGVIAMLAFFNNAMISSTQRHLSYSMGKDVTSEVNGVFNASLQIHLVISVLILILGESIGLILIKTLLEIPEDRMYAAIWVYQFVVFIVITDVLSVPFQALTNAKEDMQVIAVRDIVHSLGKLFIAIALGWVVLDRLILYGALMFLLNIGVAFSFYWFCKKHYKETTIEFKKYGKELYNDLTGFAGWTLFGALAAVSRNQGNAVILNIFFGPRMNAAYGVANQLSTQALSISNIFLQASNPQIVKSFGAGDKDNSYKLANLISRFSFYVLFIFSAPVIINIDFILEIWLKEVPDYANIFSRLLLINFLIGVISNPIITLIQATGEIRKFQIVNGTLFILNIPLAFLLLKVGYPPYSIFISLIAITFIGVMIKLYFINLLDAFPIRKWLSEVLKNLLIVVILSLLCLLALHQFVFFQSELLVAISSFLLSFLVITMIIFFFGLNKMERKYILKFILKKVRT